MKFKETADMQGKQGKEGWFTFTFSYAEPTLSSKERNDSEFLSCPSFVETDDPNPPRSDEVFSAVVLITDSVFW